MINYKDLKYFIENKFHIFGFFFHKHKERRGEVRREKRTHPEYISGSVKWISSSYTKTFLLKTRKSKGSFVSEAREREKNIKKS